MKLHNLKRILGCALSGPRLGSTKQRTENMRRTSLAGYALAGTLLLAGLATEAFASSQMCRVQWTIKVPQSQVANRYQPGQQTFLTAQCGGQCIVGTCSERQSGPVAVASDPGPANGVLVKPIQCVCWGDADGDGVMDADEWTASGLDICTSFLYRNAETNQVIWANCAPFGCPGSECIIDLEFSSPGVDGGVVGDWWFFHPGCKCL